jgi:hypothetical protein
MIEMINVEPSVLPFMRTGANTSRISPDRRIPRHPDFSFSSAYSDSSIMRSSN